MIRVRYSAAVVGVTLVSGCSGLSNVSLSPGTQLPETLHLAVLDFEWTPPVAELKGGHTVVSAPNAGLFLADSVSNRLLGIPGLEVMERSKLNKLLSERDLSQADLIQKGEYEEIGKFLGVDALVIGAVPSYTAWAYGFWSGHMVAFSCRCVDVNTSKVLWSLSGQREAGPYGPLDPAGSANMILDDAIPKLERLIRATRK